MKVERLELKLDFLFDINQGTVSVKAVGLIVGYRGVPISASIKQLKQSF